MLGSKKFVLPLIALQLVSTMAFAELSVGDQSAQIQTAASVGVSQGTASFSVTSNLIVRVLKTDDLRFKGLEGGQLTIGAGSDLTVLESRMDSQLGNVVHIGINNDEDIDGISDLWVPAEDLVNENLQKENDIAFGQEIQQSESGIVMDDIAGKVGARPKKKKMTYCYRFVKEYLLKTGKVPVYLPGGSAYMAAGTLPKYGFKRLSIKPSQASIGDVCVYHGGKGGNGHIEVLTAKGWYYGYGYISHPIANHPFIACFRK